MSDQDSENPKRHVCWINSRHTCSRNSLPITVLHVNYQLRGEESDGDQAFVETYCQIHTIPIHVHRVDLKEKLTSGGNLQQLARKERYAFFETHLNQTPNSYLLVAQHQDDQLETFWLQLYRGSGMSGLQGMLDKNGRIWDIWIRADIGPNKQLSNILYGIS